MDLRVLKVLSTYLYPEQAYSSAEMRYCQVTRVEYMYCNACNKIFDRIRIALLQDQPIHESSKLKFVEYCL